MRKITKVKTSQIVMMIHPDVNNVTPILPKGFDPNPTPKKSRSYRKAA